MGSYSSPLQVTVNPAQSSFFAGEDFYATITFTNTNPVVAHTQPIPQTASFPTDPYPYHLPSSPSPSPSPTPSTSTTPSQNHNPFNSASHPPRRVVSNLPFPPTHAKSKSVDVRTIASQQRATSDYPPNSEAINSRKPKGHHHVRELDDLSLPTRKRLIGSDAKPVASRSSIEQYFPKLSTNGQRIPGHHAKSASVSIIGQSSHQHHRNYIGLGLPSASKPREGGGQAARHPSSDLEPTTPSPSHRSSWSRGATPASPSPSSALSPSPSLAVGRKASGTISSKHPHSRKKSVIQTQAEDLTEAFELDAGADADASTDPNQLDPAKGFGPETPGEVEQVPRASNDFYGLGKNDTMESVFRDTITDWSRDARRGSTASIAADGASPIYPNANLVPPGSEKILWSFVQLGGTLEIDESLIKPGDFENVKRKLAYGEAVSASWNTSAASPSMPGTPRTLGGGDLGHDADEPSSAASRLGWSDYFRSALSSHGKSRLSRHRRTGSTLQDTRDRTMSSRSIPTFSSPPSILAVDLLLGPGESRTYSFKIKLPVDLPPSFQGKSIKFNYNLSIGTNKVDVLNRSRHGQKSRLIQIPIRVYNHITTVGVSPFYDLTNPIIQLREEAITKLEEQSTPFSNSIKPASSPVSEPPTDPLAQKRATTVEKKQLFEYARALVEANGSEAKEGGGGGSGSGGREAERFLKMPNQAEALETCKSAVEILSRTSQKVSYDISKDGKVAAVLTLVKSRYRLGDTVLGVVSINQSGSLAKIARISATLETFEEIQPSISTLPSGRVQRLTRKMHAEHHESTLDKGRTCFHLPIPSGATPDFVTSGVKLNWTVKLCFLTISNLKNQISEQIPPPPPPPHLLPLPTDGFSLYHSSYTSIPSLSGIQRGTKLETVECSIPLNVLPNSTRFKVGAVSFSA
ncbi:Rgp1-domain-containing protein [Violaceomyces palustris]|uniref:Rgp1-domain-containing protein n=1 Tax=Violaceomyces palustris TaxID=1673888 RepID=A0ACD0NN00_9BASI|nr:Rgp1-domain-containing protein [Violaceomyces palustris]